MPTDPSYDPRADPILREFLARVREAVGKEPVETILFGSRARGDHDPTSDYDLIMVYDEVTPGMREAIRKVESRIGIDNGTLISYFLFSTADLPKLTHEPFFVSAYREGVDLRGSSRMNSTGSPTLQREFSGM